MASVTSLPFVGGELSSFDPNDGTTIEQPATTVNAYPTYNPTYSRCAISCYAANGLGCTSPTWTSASTMWFHVVVCWVTYGYYSGGPSNCVILYNGSTAVAQLVVSMSGQGGNGTMQLQTLQGGTMTNVGSAVPFTPTLQTVDVQLTAGASGTAALYLGGTLSASGSGLSHSGFSGVTQIGLYGLAQGSIQAYAFYSQVICDTTSTVGRFLITDNFDTESAANNGWTGSGGATKLADINDVPNNDSTFIYAASASLTDTFYQSTLSLGTYTILGRAVSARARVQGAGPANIKLTTRVSGTNYVTANIALGAGYTATAYTWTVNPATSGAWSPGTAAAAELGVQSAT